MYFSGQGKLFIGTRQANGSAGVFRYVGNVPELKIGLETSVIEHKESTSGQRLSDQRLITEDKASVEFPFEDFKKENLAVALYGVATNEAASNVTAEAFPNLVANDDYVRLEFPNVSSVVIKDSAGTPATLVLDTDYAIESAAHGMIQILNVGTFVQPFKADYSYATHDYVAMFSQAPPERWLRFEGLNTSDTNKPVLIELYRVFLDPLAELDAIIDEFGKMALKGSVLYDSTKVGNARLGQFGRFVHI